MQPPDPSAVAAAELLRRRAGRSCLTDYLTYIRPRRTRSELDLATGKTVDKLIEPGYQVNWHHGLICRTVDRVLARELPPRLALFVPPGRGKSEIISRGLPGYIFGKWPRTRIIAASHTADLAQAMSRDAQRWMETEEYQTLFPEVRLPSLNARTAGAPLRNADEWEILDANGRRHGGSYKCTGVFGAIAGRRFEVGLIDDPIRGARDADSRLTRDRQWEWYVREFHSRRAGPDAIIILIVTRWHEDDLAGRLLAEQERGGEEWHVLSLPELVEEDMVLHPEDPRKPGEVLWPERYPLEDTLRVRDLGGEGGRRAFQSLYQQRPAPASGHIWQSDWLHSYWRKAHQPHILVIINPDGARTEIDQWALLRYMTIDPAFTEDEENDWSAIGVWGLERETSRLFLLDMVRRRLESPELLRTIRELKERWRVSSIYFEAQAAAKGVVQLARRPPRGQTPLLMTEVRADRDKVARSLSVAPWVELNGLWLPASAGWRSTYEKELKVFPYGTHDDMVDMTVYAVLALLTRAVLPAKPPLVGAPRRAYWERR